MWGGPQPSCSSAYLMDERCPMCTAASAVQGFRNSQGGLCHTSNTTDRALADCVLNSGPLAPTGQRDPRRSEESPSSCVLVGKIWKW